jgi:hypothetical protein
VVSANESWDDFPTRRTSMVAGTNTASVLAPLAVLVSCALLVLMQLYLAILLTAVLGEALGAEPTGAGRRVAAQPGQRHPCPQPAGCPAQQRCAPGQGEVAGA